MSKLAMFICCSAIVVIAALVDSSLPFFFFARFVDSPVARRRPLFQRSALRALLLMGLTTTSPMLQTAKDTMTICWKIWQRP